MTFELFDLSVMKEDRFLLKELIEDSNKYGSLIHGHYYLDYCWIIKQLPKKLKNLSIIDAGCGLGTLQFYLAEHNVDVYAFDILPYGEILIPKYKIQNYHFHQIYLGDDRVTIPCKDNFFDYVVSCSAFEHNLPTMYLNSVRNSISLLKVGGKLIMTLPFNDKYSIADTMLIFGLDEPERLVKALDNVELDTKFNNKNDFRELYDKFVYYGNNLGFLPGGIVLKKVK